MNLQSVQVQEDGWSLFSLKNEEGGRCSVCIAPNESTARISFYYRFSNGDLSSRHELLDAHMVPQDLRDLMGKNLFGEDACGNKKFEGLHRLWVSVREDIRRGRTFQAA